MIKSEIVAHSVNPKGIELVSYLVTFPTIILKEVLTHRAFSRNTSSSRAIPFNRMVEAVEKTPFIPLAWQIKHSGMQGGEYITDKDHIKSKVDIWLKARDSAVNNAKELNANLKSLKVSEGNLHPSEIDGTSVTKQLCNRLLEPFMWTTMIITTNKDGLDNFWKLRAPEYNNSKLHSHKDVYFRARGEYIEMYGEGQNWTEEQWFKSSLSGAEIHIQALAESMYNEYIAVEDNKVNLNAGEWHIPFEGNIIDMMDEDFDYNEYVDVVVKASVALAARASYTLVEYVDKPLDELIGLHDRLVAMDPFHASPMEHCNRAEDNDKFSGNIQGFTQYRHMLEDGVKL